MEYRLSRIAAISGGTPEGPDHTVRSAITDSRMAAAADRPVFFAIAGVNHDGHKYIGELYARGVRSFVVERPVDAAQFPEAGFVHVAGSVDALQRLATHHRNTFTGTVVAVTGSNGKTIVKEWAAQLAPPAVRVARSPKSYNSQIGVPLSVLMMRGDEQVVILEAGISRPGEMERLERIIRPDIGIVTTLGDAHQENFRSVTDKLDEKLKLFRGARTVIYNGNHPAVAAQIRKLSANPVDAAQQAEAYAFSSERTAQENAASAVALWDVLGVPHAETVARLPLLQSVAMRLELKEGINGSLIIDDSYNSDINSLGIALDYMKSVAAGRPQTLILSDILQSGMADGELYAKVAAMAAGVEHVVGIGERIRSHAGLFGGTGQFHPSAEAFLAAMDQRELAGNIILVKGNRSSQFEKLSHALQLRTHTTTLEIDLDAMAANLSRLRSKLRPTTRIMAMIKAFGYGNGGYEVAATLQRQGVDYLAVAFADEGVALRERGITAPIVVLNADSDSFDVTIRHGLEPEIYNFASLDAFLAAVARHSETHYPIHVKLDTGMHRLGFCEEDMPRLAELLHGEGRVRVATVFSHLAASDEPSQEDFTRGQIALFDRMSDRLGCPALRHIANSAAAERYPEAQFDMVRLGIGLYGISASGDRALQPVGTLRTRIVQVKELAAGETAGYGRAGRIDRPTRLATIPVGYADGLDRRLGEGRWRMRVAGGTAPTVGRICMDTCMIDITGLDAREGDDVVVFGPAAGFRPEDMARVLGTIPYEIMTSIPGRVKRIFIKE